MKVWMVEQGQYSYYCVVGIFSTRGGMAPFSGTITRDGVIEFDPIEEWDEYFDPQFFYVWPAGMSIDFPGKSVAKFSCFARDQEHATKIAGERRARAIAEGKFDPKEKP